MLNNAKNRDLNADRIAVLQGEVDELKRREEALKKLVGTQEEYITYLLTQIPNVPISHAALSSPEKKPAIKPDISQPLPHDSPANSDQNRILRLLVNLIFEKEIQSRWQSSHKLDSDNFKKQLTAELAKAYARLETHLTSVGEKKAIAAAIANALLAEPRFIETGVISEGVISREIDAYIRSKETSPAVSARIIASSLQAAPEQPKLVPSQSPISVAPRSTIYQTPKQMNRSQYIAAKRQKHILQVLDSRMQTHIASVDEKKAIAAAIENALVVDPRFIETGVISEDVISREIDAYIRSKESSPAVSARIIASDPQAAPEQPKLVPSQSPISVAPRSTIYQTPEQMNREDYLALAGMKKERLQQLLAGEVMMNREDYLALKAMKERHLKYGI